MSTDRTRPSDDRRQGYRGVRFQQGRVVLDRDLNAAQDILAGAGQDAALDFVGPVGTPGDDDFLVGITKAKNDDFNLSIAPGVMYVGGLRLEFPALSLKGGGYTYTNQPQWLAPDEVKWKKFPTTEVVGLLATDGDLTWPEDLDLLDPGLGGPDSAGRRWVRTQVVRYEVKAADCEAATDALITDWAAKGYTYHPATAALVPHGTLNVEFNTGTAAGGPCDPEPAGAFLHPDNQHVRVKRDGNAILWGFDNAAFLYKVKTVTNTKSVTLEAVPVDASRQPKKGQYVEVLRAAAKLPNGEYAAEPNGHVTALDANYAGGVLSLTTAMPADYAGATLFVRVWESRHAIGTAAVPLVAANKEPTGVQVTVTGSPPDGAFWSFAVRPGVETDRQILPARFKTGQPPDGPRAWFCQLALVEWANATAGKVKHDCRRKFDNLVELTDRKFEGGGGCCDITVTPAMAPTGELEKFIKDAVTQAKQPVRVCFRPGTYALANPLTLPESYAGITLEGCGDVTLGASEKATAGAFLDGLVIAAGCDDVTIRGLHFTPPGTDAIAAFAARGATKAIVNNLEAVAGKFVSAVAIRAANPIGLTVEDCAFTFPVVGNAAVFAAGVFAHGNCTGFRLRGCRWDQPRTGANLTDPNAEPNKTKSQNKLKQIGVAVYSFLDATGRLPQTLGDLLPYLDNSPQAFVHPSQRKRMPAQLAGEALKQWVNQNADYVYLRPPDPKGLTEDRVLAHEVQLPGMRKINLINGKGVVADMKIDEASKPIVASGGKPLAPADADRTRGWFGALVTRAVGSYGESTGSTKYRNTPFLHRVDVADNTFVGTTLGLLAFAAFGDVTVRGNRAADCPGAVWVVPQDMLEWVTNHLETYVGMTVADAFPPMPVEVPERVAEAADGSLRITDNNFDCRPQSESGSTFAVLVSGTPPVVFTGNGIAGPFTIGVGRARQTVMLGGNQVTTPASLKPTVRVRRVNTVTVTGNVIASSWVWATPFPPQALQIDDLLSPGEYPGDQVTVTGNVFTGEVNWNELARSKTPAWRDLNSEQ